MISHLHPAWLATPITLPIRAWCLLNGQLVSDIMVQKRCLLLTIAILMIVFTLSWFNLLHLYSLSTESLKESKATDTDAAVKLPPVSPHLTSSSNLSSGFTTINPRIEHNANISGNQAQNVSRVDLLIVVTSSPENIERRNVIRKSWASSPSILSGQVKVVFMLGQKVNMSESERVAIQES